MSPKHFFNDSYLPKLQGGYGHVLQVLQVSYGNVLGVLLRKIKYPRTWFNIKMSSYQYRKSHCGDKTSIRPSPQDGNQGILHLWSKFGNPSLKGWWVMSQTNSWLMHPHQQTETKATTIAKAQNQPWVKIYLHLYNWNGTDSLNLISQKTHKSCIVSTMAADALAMHGAGSCHHDISSHGTDPVCPE